MFIWSDTFETKIDLVDLQHKNIFDLLSKLSLSIKHGNPSYEEMNNSIKMLIHYTKTHLNDEELLMMESRIDKRHLFRHRMEHNSFLYDVDRFSDITSSDESITEKAEKIIRFITHWFIFHILGTDMLMSAQMTNIQSGMSPQQAYDLLKDHKIDTASIHFMLDAVINLWIDAKQRCVYLENKAYKLENKIASMQSELDLLSLDQTQ